ncbi:hypothetical protein TIFTF001_012563 [Ficus carica]|uniref:Uncharacterized protein n=1 Tax=Ficus carica TaxID=3494 RepID=A0AA88ANI6_FICCA|nr:hypothetical protein TIFTF001_012563 [Ficus carica]
MLSSSILTTSPSLSLGFLPPGLILESRRGGWCPAASVHRTPGIGTAGGQCGTDWGLQSKLDQKVSLPTIFGFGNHRAESFLPTLIRLHRPCTPPPARTRTCLDDSPCLELGFVNFGHFMDGFALILPLYGPKPGRVWCFGFLIIDVGSGFLAFCSFSYRVQEIPRRATGESYPWDQAKETVFLEKLDYYVACHSGRHPPISILDGWAREFNAAFGGVLAYGLTLSQKNDRMKKIYRGWKALQCRTGLGYDSVTDRVICSDDQ